MLICISPVTACVCVCVRAYLHYAAEVAVCGELQALFLSPGLDVAELLAQDGAPVVRAQTRVGFSHQLVEQPHVDEVEELREQLDGEGRVHTATAQQRHGACQRVQHVLCGTGNKETSSQHRRLISYSKVFW